MRVSGRFPALPLVVLLLSCLAATPSHAVEGDVAPMLGLRFLGEFEVRDASDETLDPGLSFGVMVDFAVFKQGNLHLLLSHPESELDAEDADGEHVAFDFDVDYIHLGISYEFGPDKLRKYVGMTLGATDEFSYNITEDPVSVHDLHATLLRLLGFDHKRLTFKFQGRHYRLTDVHGEIVEPILA